MANPLLGESGLPFKAVPFDRLTVDHYLPALTEAVRMAKDRIAAIKAESTPTFDNTIRAIEEATAPAYHVAVVYHNLRAADGDAAMQALAKELMPRLVELESDINLDEALFKRVQAVHDQRESLGPEERMLTEKIWLSFKRGGGLLNEEGKAKLRAIDTELSTLGPQFSENVLKATNEYALHITDAAELEGLPETAKEAAREAAKDRGFTGWVFTLHEPSALPFLSYCNSRERRRELWMAYSSRGLDGPHSNRKLVSRIVRLRHERARLLGYESHAHFQMEERMASDPETVRAFLERLLEVARPAAERELEELREFKRERTGDGAIEHWDLRYWTNKLREARYAFDQEELRPYFSLENVLEGAFALANRLYGVSFTPAEGVPVYHPEVQVYKVLDEDGSYLGLLYGDFFPRATKTAGAWCTRFRGQWEANGALERPHVSIVCNFTKPTPGKPSLLTHGEVRTLFHEFGHALHSLFSKCKYRSLSCTNVYRDFVELPSQIMENWVLEAEGLDLFARHYETGEPLPRALIDKLERAEKFQAAMMLLRQLRFGLLDMAWHSGEPNGDDDLEAFERRATAPADLLEPVPGTATSGWFQHIFAGGYSAGYYGYKWAEVLDADAFEMFKEKGLFDRETARRFRETILARGGSVHPRELYRRFRGREPDPEALLRRAGLA